MRGRRVGKSEHVRMRCWPWMEASVSSSEKWECLHSHPRVAQRRHRPPDGCQFLSAEEDGGQAGVPRFSEGRSPGSASEGTEHDTGTPGPRLHSQVADRAPTKRPALSELLTCLRDLLKSHDTWVRVLPTKNQALGMPTLWVPGVRWADTPVPALSAGLPWGEWGRL